MIAVSEYYSVDNKRKAIVYEGDGTYSITYLDINDKDNVGRSIMYPHLLLSDVEDLAEDFVNS